MVTIFIVDDEVILHRLYKDVFSIKGHEVVADAYDGAEAVEKFTSFDVKPEVIILDHRMPNKDGMQTMKEILDIDSSAKIVFISADANVSSQSHNRSEANMPTRLLIARWAMVVLRLRISITISTVTGSSVTCQTS